MSLLFCQKTFPFVDKRIKVGNILAIPLVFFLETRYNKSAKMQQEGTMNTLKFNKGNVQMVAHRGLSGIERENTAAAFVAAANRSYYGIETDLYRTADGHFVTNHDRTLERVGGVDIEIEQSTLKELQDIVLFDKDGTKSRADLRPCTLENYISICKKYEKHCVLELKSEFTDAETEQYIRIIQDLDYLEQVTFISFHYENLCKVRERLPTQSIQFLSGEMNGDILEKAKRNKFDVDIYFKALNEENIKALHDAGIQINCWTVDDPTDGEKLAQMGVDYITTNIME